jgi:Flp pilus assembly protein TadG
MGTCRTFVKRECGGATVEFVALMPAFLLLTFFIFEIIVAVLWVGTAEKAAQLGARLAIVSDYAVTTLTPTTTNLASAITYPPGSQCGGTTDKCTPFATQKCDGNVATGASNPCSATFTTIVNRMSSISALIKAKYVTITYSYAQLGFVTGRVVPSVTVTLSGVPYDTLVTTIVSSFFKLTNPSATSPLTTLPAISVTLTGEDLSSAGA